MSAHGRAPATRAAARKETPETRVIRVLFVNDHLGYAGGQIHGVTRYLANVIPGLAEAGLRPHLCILRGPHAEGAAFFREEGIEPVFLRRAKWDPRALPDLVRVIRERGIDLLHVAGAKGCLLGRLAGRLTRRPVLVHMHDTIPFGRLYRSLQRRVAGWTGAAIAISEPVRSLGVRNMSLPADRIEILPYGLRLDRFARAAPDARARLREEFEIPDDAPVVAIVGRVSREKGHEVLLESMAELRERVPDARLLVVGGGPLRRDLEKRAEAPDLAGVIHFTGYRSDVHDVLAAVDLLAMPSLWDEGFGLSALEAIVAGRPVVGFRVGGIPMTVVNGKTGYLVERGDARGLTERMVEVLTDPELAARLSEGCREHATEFALERHVRRLIEIYRGLLERPDNGAA